MSEQPGTDLAGVDGLIEACAVSQRNLVDHLRLLPGGTDPASASELPDWTLGHVLTHIARNADSMLRMLDGLPQYWKGPESRNSDIALGAERTWAELVDDVTTTCEAVERRMRETSDWSGVVQTTTSQRPKAMIPSLRQREVEVHRSDLHLGYWFGDMPTDYVRRDTRLMQMQWQSRQPMGLTPLPPDVVELPEHERLAWLLGRITVAGVAPAGSY